MLFAKQFVHSVTVQPRRCLELPGLVFNVFLSLSNHPEFTAVDDNNSVGYPLICRGPLL